jgi:hypothetical protein
VNIAAASFLLPAMTGSDRPSYRSTAPGLSTEISAHEFTGTLDSRLNRRLPVIFAPSEVVERTKKLVEK